MRWKTLCAAAAALVMSVVFLLPVSAAGVYQELEGEDGRKIYVTVPENYNPAYEYPSVYFMPKDGYSAQQYMADHVGEEVRSIAVFPELTGETDPWSQIRSAVSVVEEHYKVSRKPSMRGILGTGTGGYLAFLLGYCDDSGSLAKEPELTGVFETIKTIPGQEDLDIPATEIGSMVYAVKPGDGSAREQAASCQRVIGGLANITKEYATKRYRSNVMNWGMLPFQMDAEPDAFEVGDYIYVPGIRKALDDNALDSIKAYVIKDGRTTGLDLYITPMTENEREIVKAGCLINFNRNRKK